MQRAIIAEYPHGVVRARDFYVRQGKREVLISSDFETAAKLDAQYHREREKWEGIPNDSVSIRTLDRVQMPTVRHAGNRLDFRETRAAIAAPCLERFCVLVA